MKIKLHILAMIVVAFLFASCSQKILYTESVGFVDYSTYLNEGIFLTESNSVNFEYDAIGSVSAVVYSGDAVVSQSEQVDKNEIYGERTKVKNKVGWKAASPDDALNAAVAQVRKQGGNGLINIKITPTTEIDNAKRVRTGFLITGMAIKRK
ncbi:hypothetical protein [uncultured Duncaniella sp.]|uniref:hypothetical protein n=1 Tax=uncultured Duncaniella sp. TaxID=2768039 RepID=UPI00272D1BEB|nr:hypothetical protein [uncultured Duncaniella sp.]